MATGPAITGGNEHAPTFRLFCGRGSWRSGPLRPATDVVERSNLVGVGTGDTATLLADSGAPVPVGALVGHTATVPAASTRATLFTVVPSPMASARTGTVVAGPLDRRMRRE